MCFWTDLGVFWGEKLVIKVSYGIYLVYLGENRLKIIFLSKKIQDSTFWPTYWPETISIDDVSSILFKKKIDGWCIICSIKKKHGRA